MNALFMGRMGGDDLSKAFVSADVFVMPSHSETLGFVQYSNCILFKKIAIVYYMSFAFTFCCRDSRHFLKLLDECEFIRERIPVIVKLTSLGYLFRNSISGVLNLYLLNMTRSFVI